MPLVAAVAWSCLVLTAAPLAAAESAPAKLDAGGLMELSIEDLMSIEVTSLSKKPQKLSDAAAAIFVITQDDIRRSGITSIPEALRLAPGIQVAKLNQGRWAISSRGFNSRFANKLLVMIDGRTVYSPTTNGVFWELQDVVLEDIDRIEVIRGPGGSLWGANAVNGVINILTKKARDTQGFMASGLVGTQESGGTLRYGGKIGQDLQYRVYGKYRNFDTAFHPLGAHDDWQGGQGGFRMDWDASTRDSFTLSGDYFKGEAGQQFQIPTRTPPRFSRTEDANTTQEHNNLNLRWKRQLGQGSDLALQFYWDRTNFNDITFKDRVNTYDLDFQHRFPLIPGQEIVWGLGYRLMAMEANNSTTTTILTSPKKDLSLYTVFLQDEIQLIKERLALTVGAKILHNEYTGFEYQPSARLHWTVTPTQSAWLAVSRAVKTPGRFESETSVNIFGTPGGFGQLVSNPQLRSERVVAYEIGYRIQPIDRFSLDLATFYNTYTRLLGTQSVGRGNVMFVNNMSGDTYGLEAAIDWRMLDWWRFRSSYSYLQMILDSPFGTTTAGTTTASNPQNQFSIRSITNVTKNVEFDAWLRYVGPLAAQNVPGYTTMDLRLGWSPSPNLELALVGQNLLDKMHPEFFSREVQSQLTEVQRSIYGKVTWRW
ncbi:MAG: TonB-dependent receptor [Nitrospiraceae bacterium]|nr:TonB-dependent receptor [Nitrospiraceae bacterium]